MPLVIMRGLLQRRDLNRGLSQIGILIVSMQPMYCGGDFSVTVHVTHATFTKVSYLPQGTLFVLP